MSLVGRFSARELCWMSGEGQRMNKEGRPLVNHPQTAPRATNERGGSYIHPGGGGELGTGEPVKQTKACRSSGRKRKVGKSEEGTGENRKFQRVASFLHRASEGANID